MDFSAKLSRLEGYFQRLGSVAVGFSGGVDSTLLAVVSQKVLGEKSIALSGYSETMARHEADDINKIVKDFGLKHEWLNTPELADELFIANTPERCYFCKRQRFGNLVDWALSHGYEWVADGSNVDDLADYRPGMKAIAELSSVKSPFLDIGFSKADIRQISREIGLPTWDKPSAACLVSRLAYGLEVTGERLRQVDLAEDYIRQFVRGQVRVRHHGDLARIEVSPEQMQKLFEREVADQILSKLKELGFIFVTLDLECYRTGSMNEVLGEV